MKAGGEITAEYEVPAAEWYFRENGEEVMPFAVLLEIALQPCGWFAAYMGSALTSSDDLSFRNLGGSGTVHRFVTPETGMLRTHVKCTKIASSGGTIIQNYEFRVEDRMGTVYQGDTYFGFFTRAALAKQVGIRETAPAEDEGSFSGTGFPFPSGPDMPDLMLRMMDAVTVYVPDGGPQRLGFIRGCKRIDPGEWFFKAHFFQDPVWPGSLGLEAMLQLMRVFAAKRWDGDPVAAGATQPGIRHEWIYRGQVTPGHGEVAVEAAITSRDDAARILTADGLLSVDGKIIYRMMNFSVGPW